jgi:signal transduction histidine kinase/ActR/RegA family two-component response regulator
MPLATTHMLHQIANGVLAAASLASAVLIARVVTRRPAQSREALAVALCLFFAAMGVRAATRAILGDVEMAPGGMAGTIIGVDMLSAVAAVAFLTLRGRYGVFLEGAARAREYLTEVAEKDREARALAQVNEELRRLDELKSEFLAVMSHELRTPLTAIIGYSRLLTRQVHGPLTPKQLEHQEAIFRSAQRLSDLINDLLDVSRLEAARVELSPRPTDARHVVQQAMSVVHAAAEAKQIRLASAMPNDLPLVQADPSRLHQIVVNLLGNAVKFTPAGGSVRVEGGDTTGHAWIAVEDSGVGIAPNQLAQIWDPFFQAESPLERRHGGSGLGLTIVRRLVELHGGLVRAESEGVNHGSRFTFTLPLAAMPAAPPRPSEADADVEPVLAGCRVLIVEDEPQNQALMRTVVEDMLGGSARLCGDGERAVQQAIAQPPALILLDLMLPGVSGWQVARRLREAPETRSVPIVAVSALARSQERETALHAGCDAFVVKPFTPDELAQVVSTVLLKDMATR